MSSGKSPFRGHSQTLDELVENHAWALEVASLGNTAPTVHQVDQFEVNMTGCLAV